MLHVYGSIFLIGEITTHRLIYINKNLAYGHKKEFFLYFIEKKIRRTPTLTGILRPKFTVLF